MELYILIMRNRIFLSFFIVTSIVGCTKLSEGVVHIIDFPEHDPQLAVTLIANEGDDNLIALVYSSASVMDSVGSKPVADAVITLSTAEAEVVFSLSSADFSNSLYTQFLDNPLENISGELTLTVDAPDYETVTATSKMPTKPVFEIIYEHAIDTITYPFGGQYIRDQYVINIENNLNENNTYLIYIDGRYLDMETGLLQPWKNLSVETRLDPRLLVLDSFMGILISDEQATEDPSALNDIFLYTQSGQFEGDTPLEIRVRIKALSIELANYTESIDQLAMNGADLFATSQTVYSNISSGFGCFGLASETIIVID